MSNNIENSYLCLQSSSSVVKLCDTDFNLKSNEMITIKYKDLLMVLFYASNTDSEKLLKLWNAAAKQTIGVTFAAVDLINEKNISNAFSKLNQLNTSLKWASLKNIPFVLIYKDGWPISYYTGKHNISSIVNYSLKLGYNETYDDFFCKNLLNTTNKYKKIKMKPIIP